jgi:hypothetical protein
MFALIASRERHIFIRRLLRFLDESVEQDHPGLLVDIEEHSCDSVLGQTRADFIDGVSQWLADRHPNRPAKLDSFDVLSDAFPVLGWQFP